MSKCSAKLGFTFRVGKASNQFGKVDIEVSDVDTSLPLDAQISDIDNALDLILSYLHNKIDIEVEKIYGNVDDSKS